MSRWCLTCSLEKVNGGYESCTKNCPVFGKTYEELAEVVIRQKEEINALQWTNRQIIKVEKEKRRQLWKKAITEFTDRLIDRAGLIRVNAFDSNWSISQDDLDNIIEEMTNYIKE